MDLLDLKIINLPIQSKSILREPIIYGIGLCPGMLHQTFGIAAYSEPACQLRMRGK